MLNCHAVIIGSIIALILSVVGGLFGFYGLAIGVLITGAMVGYLVNGDILNGMIHGAFIGVLSSTIFAIFASLIGHVSAILVLYVGFKIIGSTLLSLLMGAIGGVLGSVFRGWKLNN